MKLFNKKFFLLFFSLSFMDHMAYCSLVKEKDSGNDKATSYLGKLVEKAFQYLGFSPNENEKIIENKVGYTVVKRQRVQLIDYNMNLVVTIFNDLKQCVAGNSAKGFLFKDYIGLLDISDKFSILIHQLVNELSKDEVLEFLSRNKDDFVVMFLFGASRVNVSFSELEMEIINGNSLIVLRHSFECFKEYFNLENENAKLVYNIYYKRFKNLSVLEQFLEKRELEEYMAGKTNL